LCVKADQEDLAKQDLSREERLDLARKRLSLELLMTGVCQRESGLKQWY
jgi:hypothetical protein